MRARRRTGEYKLLVDSGAAINIIKEKVTAIDDKRQKYIKKFIMGRDEHISTETVNLTFFGQSHIYHIVPDNFPLPEEGIIGIKFFSKCQRYAITSEFLILDNIKLPFHENGEFIPGKTTKVFRIATTDQNQDVLVLDQ